ncbi:hypothetical protein EDB81DRAFT_502599 [Dactylonectria macrodidyma]|uniref:Uncharacterized protein n=1 Tax=Dactylonectria macrodidyma TaxID=307937 RepID=A0A9P9J4I4_9HYPO|nr:hypothetical protein EDB81DRAFT_502599 [Dactylonectria macrodidyma]
MCVHQRAGRLPLPPLGWMFPGTSISLPPHPHFSGRYLDNASTHHRPSRQEGEKLPDLLQLCLIRSPASNQPRSPGRRAPIPLAHVQCLSWSSIARKSSKKATRIERQPAERGWGVAFPRKAKATESSAAFRFSKTAQFLFLGFRCLAASPFWLWLASARLLQVWLSRSPEVQAKLQDEMQMAADHGQQRSIAPISTPSDNSLSLPCPCRTVFDFDVFSALSCWERWICH